MGQKLAIFILLWISPTFNLESNEMYSYFLVFYSFFFFYKYECLFSLFLTKWEYFVKFWKEQTLLHLYKQLFGWISGVKPMFM
jgi:hypothetical protein